MRKNQLRARLQAGQPVFGTLIEEIGSPFVVHALLNAGYDFAFVDMEHGRFGHQAAVDLLQMMRLTGLTALARVPDNQYHLMARLLDAGAEGLMIPRINTRQEVEAVVQACRYPPVGQRGLAVARGHNDYQEAGGLEFSAHANRENLIIIQIETRQAVENIDDLLSVPGIDAALVGPVDLSISLGIPVDFDHPAFEAAVSRVVDACQRHHLVAGMHSNNLAGLARWRQRGVLLLSASSDLDIVLEGSRQACQSLKAIG